MNHPNRFWLQAAPLSLALWAAPLVAQDLDFTASVIAVDPSAEEMEKLAAQELQRYLYRLFGHLLPVQPHSQFPHQPTFIVSTTGGALAKRLQTEGQLTADEATLGPEGFVLKTTERDGQPLAAIVGTKPVGALYGVYTFLEKLGMGFYLGGDTFPAHALPSLPPDPESRIPNQKSPLQLPADLDETHKPVFAIRGSLPWYNFLNSPTTWDLEDYRYFYEQMSKMKMNFVGFHTYDSEPFVTYVENGQHQYGAPLVTSANYGWGTVRGMKTAEFGFGTGDFFDQEEFGSRATTEAKDPNDAIVRAQAVLRAGFQFAHTRGIKVCVGFELTGDPLDPEMQRRLALRLKALVATYPMVDYVWMWQSEGRGGGGEIPPLDSPLDVLVRKQRGHFEYLGSEARIAEAVRMSVYLQLAYRILKRLAPEKRMIVSGWGGDRWMRFSDFYLGLDKTLPKDVIFAALDNIDPTSVPNVSQVYGQLSPERERWPIPWWESDGGGTRRDQWGPQCNVRPFVDLCRDVQHKGCQGMLAIHWRTRGVEEVAAYQAQFAWNPHLTYEQFYDTFARACFGPEHGLEMSAILQQLESLGPRWTGSLGQVECGGFGWFSDPRRPQPENLQALAEIRGRVQAFRDADAAAGRGASLGRYEALLSTIDWLTNYDQAAVIFNDQVLPLLSQAEAAKQSGDAATAREKAQQALELLRQAPFREAMSHWPAQLLTQSDWGVLATVNVKAYAAYEQLVARLRALLPEGAVAELTTPPSVPPVNRREDQPPLPAGGGSHQQDQPPLIVMKWPCTTYPAGRAVPLQAVVLDDREVAGVWLRYRALGQPDFAAARLHPAFRHTYRGEIPAAAVTTAGLEFYIEAKDKAGHLTYAPRGYPDVLYSATIVPAWEQAIALSEVKPTTTSAWPAVTDLRADVSDPYEVTVTWTEAASEAGGSGPASIPHYIIHRGETADFEPSDENRLSQTLLPFWYDLQVQPERTYTYAVIVHDAAGAAREAGRVTLAIPRVPPPTPPGNFQANPGRGRALLKWDPLPRPVVGYRIYRSAGGSEPELQNREGLVRGSSYLEAGLDPNIVYTYTVRAVDRGGVEGEASPPQTVQPLPPPQEPVFTAHFDGTAVSAQGLAGELRDGAGYAEGVASQALDVRNGGYAVFPDHDDLDLSGDVTVMFWMKLDQIAQIPVLLARGHWIQHGYFVQVFGNRQVRWFVGQQEAVLDAGHVELGQWTHVACTYDLHTSRIYLNGQEVGRKEVGLVNLAPWDQPLFIGQYTDVDRQFQTHGLLDEVQIFQRALSPAEIQAAYQAGIKPDQ